MDKQRQLIAARREQVCQGLPANTGLLLSSAANRRYFSGFRGADGLVLLTRQSHFLLVDPRYTFQAQREAVGMTVVVGKRLDEVLTETVGKLGLTVLEFEPEGLTYGEFQKYSAGLAQVGCSFTPNALLSDNLRLVKDEGELDLMRKAAALVDAAFSAYLLPAIQIGRSEQEIARGLELYLLQNGADALAFPTILLSGVRGQYPHGEPSDKLIASGDLVTIDYGVFCEGYAIDLTRTVVVGEPAPEQRERYAIVQKAQAEAIAAIGPGIKAQAVDAVARQLITAAGYGAAFMHSLGHGVGLKVHEAPRLGPKEETELRAGMVVTIEPGIYIEDWGGIRIEDTVLVTEQGSVPLTKSNKALLSV